MRAVLLVQTVAGCMQEREADRKAEKRSELASACCALAEKLMEGAADVAAVQADVEGALAQAREADAASPEPLQVNNMRVQAPAASPVDTRVCRVSSPPLTADQ